MSTPMRSSPPVHPTRQQLDELDALMQRMLALPVDETPESSPVTGREMPRPQAAVVRTDSGPLLVEETESAEDRPASDWEPAPIVVRRVRDPVPPPAGDEPERLVDLVPEAPDGVGPATREAGVAWYCWPLVGINWVFDGATLLLGPLGRWLRGPSGRSLLGWVGLLLLAVAVAWGVLDWLGWTW